MGTSGVRAQSFLAAAFLMAASTLLSSSRFLLARICVPTCGWTRRPPSAAPTRPRPRPARRPTYPFLDELEGPLVLGDLEQLHGAPLVGRKAAHLPDHVPHELGVLGEALRDRASQDPGLPEPGDPALCHTTTQPAKTSPKYPGQRREATQQDTTIPTLGKLLHVRKNPKLASTHRS